MSVPKHWPKKFATQKRRAVGSPLAPLCSSTSKQSAAESHGRSFAVCRAGRGTARSRVAGENEGQASGGRDDWPGREEFKGQLTATAFASPPLPASLAARPSDSPWSPFSLPRSGTWSTKARTPWERSCALLSRDGVTRVRCLRRCWARTSLRPWRAAWGALCLTREPVTARRSSRLTTIRRSFGL